MRIFSLVIGTLIATLGGLFFGLGVFRGVECVLETSQLSTTDCSGYSQLHLITLFGLLFFSVGVWMVYENIQRNRYVRPGWIRIAVLVFSLICALVVLVYVLSSIGGVGVYSNVPEGTESAPFGVYDITPTNSIPSGVQILEYEIDGNTATVKGVLQNNASVPITYVRLKLACENGQDTSFVVGSRKTKIRSLNRMTGHYEDREYEVPEAIAPGEKYHFEYEINDATVIPSCSLSVDGWTDYRTINE